jgi:protein gp37
MSTTAIEWATHVYNATTGCDRVSPGCAHCYALTAAAHLQRQEVGRAAKSLAAGKDAPRRRYSNDGDPRTSGPGFGFTVHYDKIAKPPRFPAGARVFVNSMSDVFHERMPYEALVALWRVFASRPDVSWLVLTKRADLMRERVGFLEREGDWPTWPLSNVWLGVSIENRRFVCRADELRATSAAVRFVSAEPLLGQLIPEGHGPSTNGGVAVDADAWWEDGRSADDDRPGLNLAAIDWLIAGGESGPRHRRFDPQWARDLRDACTATGTLFFFKQHGGARPTSGGRVLDGRTWSQIPGVPDRDEAVDSTAVEVGEQAALLP